mgnify:CR=1 FL=1
MSAPKDDPYKFFVVSRIESFDVGTVPFLMTELADGFDPETDTLKLDPNWPEGYNFPERVGPEKIWQR